MPLSMAIPGEVNCIKRVGGREDTRRFLETLGFVIGGEVILISKNGGRKLPSIISEIRLLLKNDHYFINAFNNKLIKIGYYDIAENLYDTFYTIRDTFSYQVVSGFPRIIVNDLPVGVSNIEYDLNNLNETDLTRSQKRQLKSVARKNQKNNIARYTKPQSKLQAFLNKFRQKAITAGEEKEQQGEMSREDSIIATYENLHDYDDFSIEDFSKDMQLTDEEKDKLAKYITEQKNKNPRKKFVDTISCKVEVGPIKDSRRGESTERGIGKEPADD